MADGRATVREELADYLCEHDGTPSSNPVAEAIRVMQQQAASAVEANRRIAEYKASEADWRESERVLKGRVAELENELLHLKDRAAKDESLWSFSVKQLTEELKVAEAELAALRIPEVAQRSAECGDPIVGSCTCFDNTETPCPLHPDLTIVNAPTVLGREVCGMWFGKGLVSQCALPRGHAGYHDKFPMVAPTKAEPDAREAAWQKQLRPDRPVMLGELTRALEQTAEYCGPAQIEPDTLLAHELRRGKPAKADPPAAEQDSPDFQFVRDCINQAVGEVHGPDVDALIDAIIELTAIVEGLSGGKAYYRERAAAAAKG